MFSSDVSDQHVGVLKLLNNSTSREGVLIGSDLAQSLPLYVLGAEQEIRIVLDKLVQNAVKFTKKGSVLVQLRSQSLENHTVKLIYQVIDIGPGIAADYISGGKIFDAFSQADSSHTRPHEGLGLGLSLCKILSNRMNGEFTVQSE